MSHKSRVWASIIPVFIATLPTLFDCYVCAIEAQLDFALCIEEPISTDYILFISKSYNRNPDLIKNNFLQALSVIENLLLAGHFRELHYFIDQAILSHFDTAVDLETLIQMFIRVCPLILIDHREKACKDIFSNITNKFGRMKCSKKLAPLLFNFALVLLDLYVIHAPRCAANLLEKNEFYPWKDLTPRFTDLLNSCSVYETIETNIHSTELSSLNYIIRLAVDRAKAYTAIYRVTHNEVLRTIARWTYTNESNSNTNHKTWPTHVYEMGQTMLDLIDQRQITVDTCTQFIEALRIRLIDNEKIDESETVNYTVNAFYIVIELPFLHSFQLKTIFF